MKYSLKIFIPVFVMFLLLINFRAKAGNPHIIYNKNSGKVLTAGDSILANWKKVDDNDASITYSGGWSTFQGNPGFNGTEHYCTTKGASAKFTFTGVKARYYGYLRGDLDIAEIRVDGKYITKVNCSYGNEYDVVLYETELLPYGTHTLEVLSTGEKAPDYEIIIDAFEYAESNETILSLKQTEYNGSDAQRWKVIPVDDTHFQLVNQAKNLAISVPETC